MARSSSTRILARGSSLLLTVAVLLMVAGLLASDRALSGATNAQARIDAEDVSAILAQALNDRLSALGSLGAVLARDTSAARFSDAAQGFARAFPGVVRLTAAGSRHVRDTMLVEDARLVRSGSASPALGSRRSRISTVPGAPDLLLLEAATDRGDTVRATIRVDSALAAPLPRDPKARLAAAVVVGRDTVPISGAPAAFAGEMLGAASVEVPSDTTWTVVVAHHRSIEALRVALWVLSIGTVALLAFGLVRERQQLASVAERSAELERLYSEVARANTAKSEFLANISHELRTPLNAIVGFVELLKDGVYGDLSPRQVPPVDRIAASATHLRHLVDQVLDIAKIAAGRVEVHPEPVVLRPFVLNIASELESLVSERGLSFSIAVGASLPRVRTDPSHLRQILVNLIGNAVKYTPEGSVSVRARLTTGVGAVAGRRLTPDDPALAERAPDPKRVWIALQVVDTGVGIARADHQRIFDEFEQVNAGPRSESMRRGTGLGLAISRRLARLLGGDIAVESDVGKGSTFTVWLPVDPADATPAPAPAEASAV